jgi:serine/threonine protein kinase/tetratricopeptide (TPR) repeat protein
MEDEAKLGRTLFKQGNYREAEQHLRNAARLQERALGIYQGYHGDTLTSKHYLGAALQKQGKNSEAEKLLREVLAGWESTCGRDHEKTLRTKYWLGVALSEQGKSIDAEKELREAMEGQERTLGGNQIATLETKYHLGAGLQKQGKDSEAEMVLRETLEGLERIYGGDSVATLPVRHHLGIVLHNLEKYDDAELLLRQLVKDEERIHGQEHLETLNSMIVLARVLQAQEKYDETEEVLRRVVYSSEWILGQGNESTLLRKRVLAIVLQKQHEYGETKEVLQQLLRLHEWIGSKDIYMLQNKAVVEEVLLKLSAPAGRLNGLFSEGQERQNPYTDLEFTEISALLKLSNPRWGKYPRTYTVLRSIGHLDMIDRLIDAGFSDYWFPVTERDLPKTLPSSIMKSFIGAQQLVMSKPLDLGKGEKGHHCHYNQGESPPFEMKRYLGSGGFGQVDEVLSLITSREYARKQIPRNLVFKRRRPDGIKMFIGEIEILKRLRHRHIVELIGSYTDPENMSLLMSPVAEMDLKEYLQRVKRSYHHELRTFFGCLAAALEYLHENKIRHKDIKPGNILIDHGRILFTDFGLSRDFTDAEGSTTTGTVNWFTYRYCAPEVGQHQPRNTKSDIWSLGVVFMEMIAIIKGMSIQKMYEFFRQDGAEEGFIQQTIDALPELIITMEEMGNQLDNRGKLGRTQTVG